MPPLNSATFARSSAQRSSMIARATCRPAVSSASSPAASTSSQYCSSGSIERRLQPGDSRISNACRSLLTNYRPIRRDRRYGQFVYFPEFLGLRRRGAGHTADSLVHSSQALHRNRTEDAPLRLQPPAFLCFNGGLQPRRPSAVLGDAALDLVHQFDRAFLDHVIHIARSEERRVGK